MRKHKSSCRGKHNFLRTNNNQPVKIALLLSVTQRRSCPTNKGNPFSYMSYKALKQTHLQFLTK